MDKLEERIGYSFSDKSLLEQALTHSSSRSTKSNIKDNERLEFLGDRVLGLIVAEKLLNKFSKEKEGDIAKRHTAFVCKEQLANIAKILNLTDFIIMSSGEVKEGGKTNESIMADGIEALLGAIYIDAGLEQAKRFIDKFWDFDANINPPIDPKTALQEWSQKEGLGLPEYKMLRRYGSDHNPTFDVEVTVAKHAPIVGKGSNKKEAEKAAAHKFLEKL